MKRLFLLGIFLALLIVTTPSHAKENLAIYNANADLEERLIFITGEFYCTDTQYAEVYLDDTLIIKNNDSQTNIEAQLPSHIEPGTYRLAVKCPKGKSFSLPKKQTSAILDITIGATGPGFTQHNLYQKTKDLSIDPGQFGTGSLTCEDKQDFLVDAGWVTYGHIPPTIRGQFKEFSIDLPDKAIFKFYNHTTTTKTVWLYIYCDDR